jgi:hypothetical protein
MLELTMLPARQGDALWIRWGEPDDLHQILIDMGTEEIGKRVRARILALPEAERRFDLLVVTHVDRDHIGGVLTCLAEADPIPGLVIGDVWFNGFAHLRGGSARTTLEPMGPAQGERLSTWLAAQPWNLAFEGGPVWRVAGEAPKTVPMHDGLELTVLGPTPPRLTALEPVWRDEVAEALRKGTLSTVSPGLESMGPKVPPVMEDAADLEALAETVTAPDGSEANGSSIALLLRYRDRSVILSGDAFASDLIDGIAALGGSGRLKLDAFKLPHHASQSNVVKTLVESVDCERWLVSTDGTQFRHPDPIALARILAYSATRPPRLAFNVRSKFSGWWDNHDWRTLFKYETEYGSDDDGLTLAFD